MTYKKNFKTYAETSTQVKGNYFNTHNIALIPSRLPRIYKKYKLAF